MLIKAPKLFEQIHHNIMNISFNYLSYKYQYITVIRHVQITILDIKLSIYFTD